MPDLRMLKVKHLILKKKTIQKFCQKFKIIEVFKWMWVFGLKDKVNTFSSYKNEEKEDKNSTEIF